MSTEDNEVQSYIQALTDERRQKDVYFRTAPDSPIPHDERRAFAGLQYFPPNPAFYVEATVEALPPGDTLTMQTSDGQQRPFERFAILRFNVEGQPGQLTAYRSPGGDEHESLFIPFRDALAGKETYGAGRYLDVEPPHLHGDEPQVILDFNLAYNPYCAYNELYSCPIPPAENTLSIPIRAGERIYHDNETA